MGACRVTARQSSPADCRSWVDRYRRPRRVRFPLAAIQERTSPEVRKLPIGDIAPRQELLLQLEHVNGETVGVNLVIDVGPEAIHLIALDIFDGHQWSS